MGYPLRPDLSGFIHHVHPRGTNKEPIFFDAFDRGEFLHRLERAALRQSWIVLAYCLLTNHFHLVLRCPHGGLSEGMQWLLSGYSRQTNLRHDRTMHLFRQPFSSRLILTDDHLRESCRYTVLNPVRAGLCTGPADWHWSSYRATAGLEVAPLFLAEHEVLRLFDTNRRRAEAAWVAYVQEGLSQVSDTADKVQQKAR
jgi:REP element-mobilizing transposase RayT